MAEGSVWWDGTATGDAAGSIFNAPLSSLEFSDVFSKLLQSDAAKGYVIPGYGNNLKVQANSPAALNVIVKSGALALRGKLYENTADNTLSLAAADATNPRLDRVVARVTFASQTVRLAILTGTPGATPALPSLTQNATTYEISLSYIWVAATATTIADTEIHDERLFAANFESLLNAYGQTNLLFNSEFMAFSRLNSIVASAGAPDRWSVVGTVTSWANSTKPAQMSRGRAVRVTAGGASAGMSQAVPVKASTTYSIKLLINVTAGDVGSVVVTTNAASPDTITRSIRRTGSWIEILIYYTTEADASILTLSMLALNNTDVVDYGQALIVEGFVPGPFRQIHETIIFDYFVSDPDFTGDTFGATGQTTIDFSSDYEGIILLGTQAVHLKLALAGTDLSVTNLLHIVPVGLTSPTLIGLQISGGTNTLTYFGGGWVTLASHTSAFDIRRHMGAGTVTVEVSIMGIVI